MDATHDRIIKAGLKLFQRAGYHGTGMAAIMAEADASKSSLYHHFPGGKEEIAIAALRWLVEQIIDHLDSLERAGATGSEMVASLAGRSMAPAGTDKPLRGSLVAVLAWDCIPGQPVVAQAIRNGVAEIIARLKRGFAREGKSDPAHAAINALALLEGASLMTRISGAPFRLLE